MNQPCASAALKPVGEIAARGKLHTALRQPAARRGGVNGIVAPNRVFGDPYPQAALKAFHGGRADAGVQVQAHNDDGIAMEFLEGRVQCEIRESVEPGFMDDGFPV